MLESPVGLIIFVINDDVQFVASGCDALNIKYTWIQ